MLEEAERGQPHDFGLGLEQAQQEPRKADRLVAQSLPVRRVLAEVE